MESDSENELLELSAEISENAITTPKVCSLNALPELSRKSYENAYRQFMDWCRDQGITSYSENTLMAYFVEISSKFKSSTLWTTYSMLKTTLGLNNGVEIQKYTRLKAFLKRKADDYLPVRAKSFTSNEINKFINEAPDEDYLLAKVVLIMGVVGACHKRDLYQMKTADINDLGSAVLVSVPDPKTKLDRRFTVTGHFYEIFKKYSNLRPRNLDEPGFFLQYHNGKCTIQKVGINKFGAMGKQIAKYLKLPNPELYKGHCFRQSASKIYAQATNVTEAALRSSENNETPNYAVVFLKSTSDDPLQLNSSSQHIGEDKEIKIEIDDDDDDVEEAREIAEVKEIEQLVPQNGQDDQDVETLTTEVKYLRIEVKRLNATIAQLNQQLSESQQNELKLQRIVKAVRIIVNQDS